MVVFMINLPWIGSPENEKSVQNTDPSILAADFSPRTRPSLFQGIPGRPFLMSSSRPVGGIKSPSRLKRD